MLAIICPTVFSVIYAHLLKQKAVEFLPVTYSFVGILVYIFSIFNEYKLGVLSILPVLLILALLGIALDRNNRLFNWEIKKIFTPALCFFIVATFWTYFHTKNMRFYEWDEFSYWGSSVKSIYFYEQIPIYSINQGAFPQYIPGLPLFGSTFVYMFGSWKESLVFWAYHVLILSVLSASISAFNWRNISRVFLAIVISLLSTIYFFNTWQSVYADPLLSIIFGYGIALAASRKILENRSYLLNLSLISGFLILTKDVAIFFVLIIFLVLLTNFFISEKNFIAKSKKIGQLSKKYLFVFLSMLPAILLWISWQKVITKFELNADGNFLSIIKDIVLGDLERTKSAFVRDLWSSYFERVVNQPVISANFLPVSTSKLILIFTILLFLAIPTKSKQKDFKRHLLLNGMLVIGTVFYLAMLFLLYATFFTQYEASTFASFDRYVGTYFSGLLVFLSFRFTDFLENSKIAIRNSKYLVGMLVFLLFQSTPPRLIGFFLNSSYYSDQLRSQYSGQSWLISEMAFDESDRVWVIAQHTSGFDFYLLQYELIPARVGKIPFSIGSPSGESDMWTDTSYTADKWRQALVDFDYVFVNNISESFKSEFSRLFEDPDSLSQLPGIYKVNLESGETTLTRVR